MTKIATIISALAEATQTIATDQWGVDHRVCCGGDTEFDHLSDCLWVQALTAARELRELKPVAWQVMDENDALREFSIKDIAQDWITTELLRGSSIVYWIRPLYALDEVKHD